MPIIIVSGWLHALALMHSGYWSTRHAPGVFYSTRTGPRGVIILEVSRNAMVSMIRHGSECTHVARAWLCAGNQIGRA